MRSMMCVLMGFMSLSTSLFASAADVAAGKSAYSVCSACHGPNGGGNQSVNSPRIAGQYDWYVKRQLQAFKDGIRGTAPGDMFGAQMRPMAMMLANEAAIDNLVAYIGTLTAPVPSATVEGDAAAGKPLYASCVECHGPKGEGNLAKNAPKLVDQDDWYLVRELQNFKKGIRGGNPKDVYGAEMKAKAKLPENDQAINNVVVYIRSLK